MATTPTLIQFITTLMFVFLVVYIFQSQFFQTQIFLHYCRESLFLTFNAASNTFVKFLAKYFWYVLRYVTPYPSQNRQRHRCFSSLCEYLFEIHIGRTSLFSELSFFASGLVLTCYTTNWAKSSGRSKNPVT